MRDSLPKAGEAVLVFKNATLRAGARFAFPRTNWTIYSGEQWAVLGPNNSGKSLLASALAGETLPVRGEINLAFAPGAEPSRQKSVVLVSPHTHHAVANAESSFYQSRWHGGLNEGQFTVGQFLLQRHVEEINPFEVNPRRTPRNRYLTRQQEAVRLLRLTPLLRRKLICLSNGEMRRALLARALCHAPRLLVLDEPCAGLDAGTRRHLARVIESLMRGGMQVIVATSRPDEIPGSATHWLLIGKHRVVAQGPKAALLKHPLVKQLRGAPHGSRRNRGKEAQIEKWKGQSGKAESDRHDPEIQSVRSSRNSLVEIADATVRFGAKRILSHISWTIRRGEHWALFGPNGSGKTTLLSLIQGDNPQAYAQKIRLFGVSSDFTQALWRARQHIGWFSPELHLHYPREWSIRDVVCSGFFNSIGLFEACTMHQRKEAKKLLNQFSLANRARATLGELSLSDQRLVLLARALVKQPRLLVLDEPCQALDSARRRQILAAVDRAVAKSGLSLVFVTHHRRELPKCITHLLRLKAGRVVYQGRLRD